MAIKKRNIKVSHPADASAYGIDTIPIPENKKFKEFAKLFFSNSKSSFHKLFNHVTYMKAKDTSSNQVCLQASTCYEILLPSFSKLQNYFLLSLLVILHVT